MTFEQVLTAARNNKDYRALIESIPYAQLIGLQALEQNQRADEPSTPRFYLPKNPNNIGNPILPAIHGGVIGGFMEMSASLHLLMTMDSLAMPKIIDFSLDYLRAGRHQDTYAECQVWRQGNRVANVAITAWQNDIDQPIATARAHFLLV